MPLDDQFSSPLGVEGYLTRTRSTWVIPASTQAFSSPLGVEGYLTGERKNRIRGLMVFVPSRG